MKKKNICPNCKKVGTLELTELGWEKCSWCREEFLLDWPKGGHCNCPDY